MKEPLVTIKNLSKTFDNQLALESINAVIPKGEMVALAGPDGAGKTTLIRLIAGLLLPTKGNITVAGLDSVAQAEEIHRLIGYMPQKFGLYEDLTVQQNLNLYADLKGIPLEKRKDKFEQLLTFTDLTSFINRLAGDLSGGMKQKLGLACTLLSTPALLLLDEPSVGVDPISRRELWKMVQDLLREGISVLWSTAYLDEAEKCQTALLLNNGQLLFQGSPNELTNRVDQRTFKITNISGNHRQVLTNALNQENVLDGIIQGSDVRLVIKEKKTPSIDLTILQAGAEATLIPTPPRFEDGFVDILGGGHGGISELAQKTPQINGKKAAIVQATGLTKYFGSFLAADHVTFSIPSGEIFGLLGPNGAGKSTTFKMMCGLLKPSQGEAHIDGFDLQKASGKARARIGYMAQKFSLYGDLSVKQNLDFFSGAYNLYGKDRQAIIAEMIEVFNFQEYLNDSAGTLPLGYKQRLALACAVMHHPPVLFLDEPTSGVDPITRREFWNHINGLVQKGITVVVTTHFMDEAEYCDRIGLMYQSKMINLGTPDALKNLAKTPENPTPSLEDAFIYLIESYEASK